MTSPIASKQNQMSTVLLSLFSPIARHRRGHFGMKYSYANRLSSNIRDCSSIVKLFSTRISIGIAEKHSDFNIAFSRTLKAVSSLSSAYISNWLISSLARRLIGELKTHIKDALINDSSMPMPIKLIVRLTSVETKSLDLSPRELTRVPRASLDEAVMCVEMRFI